jgi:hypothetical protein
MKRIDRENPSGKDPEVIRYFLDDDASEQLRRAKEAGSSGFTRASRPEQWLTELLEHDP